MPNGPRIGRMSDAMLERFISQYIAGVTGPEVVFSWQGGEPTLMGLDFFRKVIALEKKYAKPFQPSRMICRPTARSSTRNGLRF